MAFSWLIDAFSYHVDCLLHAQGATKSQEKEEAFNGAMLCRGLLRMMGGPAFVEQQRVVTGRASFQ